MVVRSSAAPPTPWSKTLAEPKIDASAYVHSFSNIIGDVVIEANVLIAPGSSIRADEGTPFYIGESTNIQDGVVIHGLEQGRVIGDDGKEYSVWVGKNASLTHKALIHGPAFIGDDCFIGFRSTVFNARVGNGCIVMMHVLIQDVEIPAGKYVPSGSIITNQQQADRLPNVQDSDIKFATHVVGINEALRAGYLCAADVACVAPIRDEAKQENSTNGFSSRATSMKLSAEVVKQVRDLLAQGCQIGTEYASQRHFRTSSWKSCSPLSATREADAIRGLEECMDQHSGDYVRLIGIDTKAKRRVAEVIIQRPNDRNGSAQSGNSATSSRATSHAPTASTGSAKASNDLSEQVSQLLNSGFQISTEYADERRFRTSSWRSAGAIQAHSPREAIAALEAIMAEHAGEYVRLIGVDPKAKRRVLEMNIQTPNGKASAGSGAKNGSTPASAPAHHSHSNGHVSSSSLSKETLDQVRQLLEQGYKISTEHADQRRFRASSWNSCSPISATHQAEVVKALEACMAEHAGEYVRLIGIDTKAKRRVLETIIQKP